MTKRTLSLACAALLMLAGGTQAQTVTLDGITYTVAPYTQTATVTDAGYNITEAHVPATVTIEGMDYPVTAIGGSAFSFCTALQSVTLPQGLQTIGGNAFYGCDALQCIILPEGLQLIDQYAFYECHTLQSITLPEGLQTIGNWAFRECPLQDIACLTATPPSIEDNTFDYDTYGTAVLTVPQGAEAAYRVAEHWAWFYDSTVENGIVYKAQEGGQSAATVYADPKITAAHVSATVNIDGTNYPVTAIGSKAFSYCDALQSVTLPQGLQTIGERAFYDCDALQSIALPEGLQSISKDTFRWCKSLQSVTFPEGLQSIGDNAFSNCDALQSVTFPEGLQTIGDNAFHGCDALQSVTFPEGLQSIGGGAFSECPLLDITCLGATPPAISNSPFDDDTYANATLTVPEGAKAAYQVAEWWEGFFHYPKIGGVQYYVDFATQEASVEDADTGITSAAIPATVEHEGTSYPVTAIGSSAFSSCSALQSIALSEGLQTIGNFAFYGCPLQDVTCLADTPPSIEGGTFDSDTYANATLHVPAGAWAAYQADPYWKRLIRYPEIGGVEYYIDFAAQEASVEDADTGITSAAIPATVEHDGTEYPVIAIGNEAFRDCSALQSIALSKGLQSIGNSAFSYCTALRSITLSEGLQSIGDNAFSNCDALQSIALSEGLQTIGSYAFQDCTALQSIILPEGLQSIGDMAFYSCAALQSITLPESLQSIGDGAFYGCPLQDITCLADTPPSIEGGTFDSDTYANATLHVPAGAWAAYQADPDWERLIRYPEIGGVEYYIGFATQEASVTGADTGITSATIPATVEHDGTEYPVIAIGSSAFSSCSALQSIALSEGLQTIGDMAFYSCRSLTSIELPSTMQKIGNDAFGDTGLRDVYSRAVTPPSIYDDTFSQSTYRLATLHVPPVAMEDYRNAMGWVLFEHIESDLPPVSIGSVAADASLATYADGILTTESPASITVYAQSGAVVRHATDATSLSLAGLPSGLYIICIEMEGQRQVMKVVL